MRRRFSRPASASTPVDSGTALTLFKTRFRLSPSTAGDKRPPSKSLLKPEVPLVALAWRVKESSPKPLMPPPAAAIVRERYGVVSKPAASPLGSGAVCESDHRFSLNGLVPETRRDC